MSDKARKSAGRSRDAEGVRRRALSAGRKLFADHGFAGTSLRQVADAAGISAGLLQYHFGSKRDLYDAVREDALNDYIESQKPQLDLPEPGFSDFLKGAVRQYFRFMEGHPEWTRLATWSVLEGDARPWPREMDFIDALVARIEAAKEARVMRQDLDTELLVIMLASIMSSWLGYRTRHASRLTHLGGPQEQQEAYLKLCDRLFDEFLFSSP